MKSEYKNIAIVRLIPGVQVECTLAKPILCTNDYFINAFWMPIKRQIGKKLVLFLQPDMRTCVLIYNQIALGFDGEVTEEQRELIKEDSEKVFEVAMDHIDRIVEHIYCKERTGDVVPFIDEYRPIVSVERNVITLNGRLPMQEAYFIKKYWESIAEQHHKDNKGVRFKIHFSDLGTKISVSAELCRYDVICTRKGLPKRDPIAAENYQLQIILCDLTDAILEAASEYAESCKEQSSKKH